MPCKWQGTDFCQFPAKVDLPACVKPRYGPTVLFCFYLLQFICSCESLYKNKVWEQTMEGLPSPPCQGLYFTHYQVFSSGELSPSIQLCESQPRSYGMGREGSLHCLSLKERQKDRQKGREKERKEGERYLPVTHPFFLKPYKQIYGILYHFNMASMSQNTR